MMPARRSDTHLIDCLPPVRGRYEADAPLSALTWFRVGGPAEVLYRPADAKDLSQFLQNLPPDVPVSVIGLGSNLLARDGGVHGVVVRMGKSFGAITRDGDIIRAGAGASDINVAAFARDAGLAGLEFLRGIPGTVGGAVRMNAGAYGHETADIVTAVEAVDAAGTLHRMERADIGFSYRKCDLPDDWIITAAEFRGVPDDRAAIAARMEAINAAREDSQPLRTRTGGSTFKNPMGKNPVNDGAGRRAWQLIDEAGCRGLRIGGAEVSTKHCNFLINTGDATAADLEHLGEEVRRRVKAATGVNLEWEIRIIGHESPKVMS